MPAVDFTPYHYSTIRMNVKVSPLNFSPNCKLYFHKGNGGNKIMCVFYLYFKEVLCLLHKDI